MIVSYGVNTGNDFSFPTDIDLSAAQYCFVVLGADGNLDLAGANARAIGVLQNDPTAGQSGTVRLMGVSKVTAGAAITQGALVASNASGEAVAYTAATANTTTGVISGSQVLGIALEAAGAAGDFVAVALFPGGLSA